MSPKTGKIKVLTRQRMLRSTSVWSVLKDTIHAGGSRTVPNLKMASYRYNLPFVFLALAGSGSAPVPVASFSPPLPPLPPPRPAHGLLRVGGFTNRVEHKRCFELKIKYLAHRASAALRHGGSRTDTNITAVAALLVCSFRLMGSARSFTPVELGVAEGVPPGIRRNLQEEQ